MTDTIFSGEERRAVIEDMISTKQGDRTFQLIVFVLSLVLIPFTLMFSLFLMGLTHAVGTFYWVTKSSELPRTKARLIITKINIVVIVLFILACGVLPSMVNDAFVGILATIFFTGVILGPAYFFITLSEINFYKKMLQDEGS